MIQDVQYIELNDNPIANFIAKRSDVFTLGRRGKIFTEAMIQAGIARNKGNLRAKYQGNKAVLNSYFDEIDLNKLVDKIGKDNVDHTINKTVGGFIKNNWIPFTIGAVVGASILALARGNS